jgi:hypothetical protein
MSLHTLLSVDPVRCVNADRCTCPLQAYGCDGQTAGLLLVSQHVHVGDRLWCVCTLASRYVHGSSLSVLLRDSNNMINRM